MDSTAYMGLDLHGIMHRISYLGRHMCILRSYACGLTWRQIEIMISGKNDIKIVGVFTA